MSYYPIEFAKPPTPPPILYHYTSQIGLIGIVSRKQLWASNINYQNDTSEFRHGEELFWRTVEKRRPSARPQQKKFFQDLKRGPFIFEASEFFITSFTEAGDLLSQWRGYTPNGIGFSIGFAADIFLQPNLGPDSNVDFTLLKCIYDESEQVSMAENWLEECLSKWANHIKPSTQKAKIGESRTFSIYPPLLFRIGLSFLSPIFKSPAFSEEKEWRLIGTCRKPDKMKFRQGASMITPYLEVDIAESAKRLGVPPIASVTVGPCPNQELSSRSVQLLLESSGITESQVTQSRVSYRGW